MEREGAVNCEDSSLATMVTELAVGITREDLTAVTAKEFDGCGGFRGFHLRSRFKAKGCFYVFVCVCVNQGEYRT